MDHPMLDDFVDGKLPWRTRRSIARHLRSCDRCRAEVEGLRRLRARTSGLPRALSPQRDLWPGVHGRIGRAFDPRPSARRVPRTMPRPAWAFALTVSVCLLFFVISPWSQAPLAVVRGVACEGSSRGAQEPEGTDPVVDHRADARDIISRHAAMVDEAIDEILAALREDPTDLGLVRQLRREYQRKASLVRTTAQLLQQIEAGVAGSTS